MPTIQEIETVGRADLQRLQEFANKLGIKEEIQEKVKNTIKLLQAQIEHLHKPFVIVIVGGNNVGKSTLMNALSGKNLSPVSPEGGFTKEFHLYRYYESEQIYTDISHLTPYLTKDAHIHNHNESSLKGKILIDTPDFDSIITKNRETLEKILPYTHLVLCVVTSEKCKKKNLLEFLTKHSRESIYIFNQIDRVNPDQREYVVKKFREYIIEEIGLKDPLIYPFSAKEAFEAKLNKRKVPEGFAQLEDYIRHRLDEENQKSVKLSNIERMVDELDIPLSDYKKDIEEVSEKLPELIENKFKKYFQYVVYEIIENLSGEKVYYEFRDKFYRSVYNQCGWFFHKYLKLKHSLNLRRFLIFVNNIRNFFKSENMIHPSFYPTKENNNSLENPKTLIGSVVERMNLPAEFQKEIDGYLSEIRQEIRDKVDTQVLRLTPSKANIIKEEVLKDLKINIREHALALQEFIHSGIKLPWFFKSFTKVISYYFLGKLIFLIVWHEVLFFIEFEKVATGQFITPWNEYLNTIILFVIVVQLQESLIKYYLNKKFTQKWNEWKSLIEVKVKEIISNHVKELPKELLNSIKESTNLLNQVSLLKREVWK